MPVGAGAAGACCHVTTLSANRVGWRLTGGTSRGAVPMGAMGLGGVYSGAVKSASSGLDPKATFGDAALTGSSCPVPDIALGQRASQNLLCDGATVDAKVT